MSAHTHNLRTAALKPWTNPCSSLTPDTVGKWLDSLKSAPDEKAIHLLIERIDIVRDGQKEKTDFNITSTLKAVLGENGCGDSQHSLPTILYNYFKGVAALV